jgi:hypothetical protein
MDSSHIRKRKFDVSLGVIIDVPNWEANEKRVLRCTQCGDVYPGAATNDGDCIPVGSASGGRCHECGNDEFEEVTLVSPD